MNIQENPTDVELANEINSKFVEFKNEISKVIFGYDDIVEQIFICMLAQSHCLLVGVPGLAKTLLVKTIAEVIDLKFNRIQFTPDLMPGDILGTDILEEDQLTKQRVFRFIEGPIFTNVLLADEINRTPPKTQSALLEAMQERKVTAGGKVHQLGDPFFVLATQNPIEQEGTYPLPEAQLDRFMFNLWIDYPTFENEVRIVKTTTGVQDYQLKKIFGRDELFKYQNLIKKVPVADNVVEYAIKLVGLSRDKNRKELSELINWGAGPRASQFLIFAAKCKSLLDGRYTPEIDDVQYAALPVLRHRIIPSFNAEADGTTSVDIIKKMIELV